MKKLLLSLILIVSLTGCVDVIRGYKSITYVHVDGESKSSFTTSPTLNVAADKEYSDAFKTNADASQNKTTTPEKQTTNTTTTKDTSEVKK